MLVLLVVGTLILGGVAPAHAGSSTDIALGLASFAVFNQLVRPFLDHQHWHHHRTVVYTTRTIYATPPPAVAVVPAPPPPPVYPTVVQYPHGRYELRGDGVTTLYQWVWLPNPPPPPPPPPTSVP
jgi:hypothetical protein